VLGAWLTNFLIAIFGTIVIYELVRVYLNSPTAAWVAGALIAIAPFTLWYVPIPSTDYSDMLIACASIWMLHRLFAAPKPSTEQIILCGILFGFLLLIKMQMTYIIFGLLLVVLLHKWRIGLALSGIPLLVWGSYTRLIGIITPYTAVEINGRWKDVTWIFTDFIYYTPFQMLRSFTRAFALFTDKTMIFFGALVIAAVVTAIVNPKFTKNIKLLWVAMFISSVAFEWVFYYTYLSHVLGLIPFVYGGVGLAVEQVQNYIQTRFSENRRLAATLSLSVLALPILHNLILWTAWDIAFRVNYTFGPPQ